MSTLALMTAVQDYLIATPDLGLTQDICAITDRGQPFASAGDLFVGVWYGYWRDKGSNGECLHTEHGVNVTVSMRATSVPMDRWGPEVLAKIKVGLLAKCERIVALIHMDPRNVTEGASSTAYSEIMRRANDIIGKDANGFVVPLQFRDGGQPELKGGGWWVASGKEQRAGFAQTLSFGMAERVQVIGDVT